MVGMIASTRNSPVKCPKQDTESASKIIIMGLYSCRPFREANIKGQPNIGGPSRPLENNAWSTDRTVLRVNVRALTYKAAEAVSWKVAVVVSEALVRISQSSLQPAFGA
jgi:hypothetical protein